MTSRVAIATVMGGVAMTCASQAAGAQTSESDASIRPLAATYAYTGEVVGNAAGGRRRGAAVLGVAGAQLTLRLRPLVGWRGARVFVFVLGTHGGAPSALVGDVQGVSNIQAPARLRLEEAWLQQNLFGNRLSWLVGRYDLNTEFYRLQSAALFVNSSFGIGPEFAGSGRAGPSIFPNTSLGTRLEFKPSPDMVGRVAALDGVPVDRPGDDGFRPFAPGDGALLVGEAVILSRPDSLGPPRHRRFQIGRGAPRAYIGKIAVGGWYYTARFPDLSESLPGGEPVQHRGSGGVYLIGDRTVWSAGRGRPAALSAFVQLGLGDGRVTQVGGYLGGGFTFTAPFAGRAQDEVGLAVASAVSGSHYDRAQAAAGTPGTSETTLELSYLAQLCSWLAVQPDVQLVIHPGGTSTRRNALAPGLRIALSR
jgi:porin